MTIRTATDNGFRQDINGLRAWAVVGVVLYHFGVPGFGGGFAGVDVFFVISGFLMAGIVIGGMESGRFSLPGFYMARARRIIPALLVVVTVVLLVGWFVLMPKDYQILGRHARESVFFTSNLTYLHEAGYFDAASHEKWLLHTWSLSVEWQFYLIYPLVVMLLQRLLPGRRSLVIAHVLLLLLSLSLSIFLVAHKPASAFFLLPSRAWELLLGGLVFLLNAQPNMGRGVRRSLECLGFSLILLAILGLDPSMPWPGALALLPTLGAMLVLISDCRVSWWTASPLAQWLGTRSYSIYLWHWPLMVWLTYFGRQHAALWITGALLLSLLLGHVSYHLIEVPVRRWLSQRSDVRALGWGLVCVVLVAASAQAVRRNGFPSRLPEEVARIDAERQNTQPRQKECAKIDSRCVIGGPKVAAVVIGDSHADSMVTAVAAALPNPKEQGVYFRAQSGCLLVDGAHSLRDATECNLLRKEMQDLDKVHPGVPVILINRLPLYAMGDQLLEGKERLKPRVYFSKPYDEPAPAFLDEFRKQYISTICRMAKAHPVYLVLPVPDMPESVPRAMTRAFMRGLPTDFRIPLEQYHARSDFSRDVQEEAARACGAHLLDPVPYLCDGKFCYGSREGMPLYLDDDHLSERGNRVLLPMFSAIFAEHALAGGVVRP